jgi:hypothetical protein
MANRKFSEVVQAEAYFASDCTLDLFTLYIKFVSILLQALQYQLQARLKSTNLGSIQDWCLDHQGSILSSILNQHLPFLTASSSSRFTLLFTLLVR